MNKTYYGNEPIKDQAEVNLIFDMYENQGILHYHDMMKLKNHIADLTRDIKRYIELGDKALNSVTTEEIKEFSALNEKLVSL